MKTVYKLTSTDLTTYGGYQWVPNEWRETSGTGGLCSQGWLHWYSDPLVGVFLDPAHAGFGSTARLWESEADGAMLDDHGLKGGSTRLRLVREIPLPVVTIEQRIRFGIFCAQENVGDRCPAWSTWAARWLSGEDRSEAAAEAARAAAGAARAAWAARAAAWAAVAVAKEAARAAWAATEVAWAVAWAAWAATEVASKAARSAARSAGTPLDLPAIARRAVEP